MKYNRFKAAMSIFTLLLTVGVYAQGPPGGGQMGGRGQGVGQGQGDRQGQERRERPDPAQIIEMLDTNDDDKISREEASKAKRGKLSEHFDAIDANEDGFIVLEELQAFFNENKPKKVSPEKIIKKADKDKDGQLSKEELDTKRTSRLLKRFKDIDTDKNGQINLEELKAFMSKNKPKRSQRRN